MKRSNEPGTPPETPHQSAKKPKQAPTATHYRTIPNGIHFSKVRGLDFTPTTTPPISSLSLLELVSRLNPTASIHFNYCIDPSWLLQQYPFRCRQSPITLVVGPDQAGQLRAQCERSFPNVTVTAARMPFPYGTHHSKLSLFESSDALHVVISTANLVESDWDRKTQAFYYWRAPTAMKGGQGSGGAAAEPGPKFQSELIEYLTLAYPSGSSAHKSVGAWVEKLRGGGDFTGCSDRLVWSYPARHVSVSGDGF